LIKDWKTENILSLLNTKGINNQQIRNFVEKYDSFEQFIRNEGNRISKISQQDLFNSLNKPGFTNPMEQIDLCEKQSVKITSIWDENYPKLLKEIHYPPVLLFYKGELNEGDFESISIIGTRQCTTYGKLAVEHFVSSFVKYGITITSGLANGIDTYSHLSAIKNQGRTIAVIASGLDMISSSYAQKNADKIVDSGGIVISEYQCGVRALPAYFPQRNRIISGISRASLVIESAESGGSLITAKFAFDQGREVFALPGSIFSEKSKGTNNLLARNLASPAVNAEYILNELGLLDEENKLDFKKKEREELSQQEKDILEIIDHEPRHIDDLSAKVSMEMSTLLVKLLELEFKGMIRQLPGKHYVKI